MTSAASSRFSTQRAGSGTWVLAHNVHRARATKTLEQVAASLTKRRYPDHLPIDEAQSGQQGTSNSASRPTAAPASTDTERGNTMAAATHRLGPLLLAFCRLPRGGVPRVSGKTPDVADRHTLCRRGQRMARQERCRNALADGQAITSLTPAGTEAGRGCSTVLSARLDRLIVDRQRPHPKPSQQSLGPLRQRPRGAAHRRRRLSARGRSSYESAGVPFERHGRGMAENGVTRRRNAHWQRLVSLHPGNPARHRPAHR